MSKKLLFFLLAGILFWGAFLRFYNLGATSLQTDEIFTATRAKSSLVNIFIKTSEEASFGYAPIDRFFVHFAFYFGKSEFIVRLPSVIFGLLSILLIYQVGKTFFNKKIGLISSFLLSISTLHLEYSQEARYYVYVVFFFLLSLLFYYKLVKEPSVKYFLLFIAAVFMSILSHLTSLIFFGIQILFACIWWLKNEKRRLKWARESRYFRAILTGGALLIVVLLGYLQGYLPLFRAVRISSTHVWPLIGYTLVNLSGSAGWILGVYITFFLLGMVVLFKKYRPEAILLSMLFFLPPTLLFFIRPQGYSFHIRYVIFILPVYLLFIALGIDFLSKTKIKAFFLLLIFALAGISSAKDYYRRPLEDWRGLGRYLEKNLQPDDVVVTETVYRKMTVEYYYERGRENSLVKTAAESFNQINKYPFRRYFLQHDYVDSSGLPKLEAIPLAETEETKSFSAGTMSMYLFVSQPIWFWQEAEINFFENRGWQISDFWGKKVMGADALASPGALISYKIDISASGNYDLYANLRWDGARGLLKYKIDNGKWSAGFQPFFGEKGDVVYKWRFKEAKLGSFYLEKGEHILTFLNQKAEDKVGRFQNIDYFYLTLNE